jgi:hydroxymethylbilane synthase
MRRQAQLLHQRADLRPALPRGNVPTRLRRLAGGEVAATLLAVAGLARSGLLRIPGVAVLPLDPDQMIPAAGQGVIAVTVREDDTALRQVLLRAEDADARITAMAERALLLELDGSCRTTIGAHAVLLPDGRLGLTGMVARTDGSFLLKQHLDRPPSDAAALVAALGRELRASSPPDIFL